MISPLGTYAQGKEIPCIFVIFNNKTIFDKLIYHISWILVWLFS